MSSQEAGFEEQIKKLKAIISEKEKEIEELRKIVSSKDLELNEIKENFLKEKEEMQKQVKLKKFIKVNWTRVYFCVNDIDYPYKVKQNLELAPNM